MKIAVLVTGIYPHDGKSYLNNYIKRLEKTFPEADFYYQTWDTNRNREIFKDLKCDILYVEKPKLFKTNPYKVLLDSDVILEKGVRKKYENLAKRNDITSQRRVWQHYGFAKLHESITKRYDRYIRIRWDTFFGDHFNLSALLTYSRNYVVGVGLQNGILNGNDDKLLDKKWQRLLRRTKAKRIVNSSFEKKFVNHCPYIMSKNYLYDFLMVYRYSDIDTNYIYRLYEEEKLHPAEFGWHQIMCGKRQFINLCGMVSILRHINDSE